MSTMKDPHLFPQSQFGKVRNLFLSAVVCPTCPSESGPKVTPGQRLRLIYLLVRDQKVDRSKSIVATASVPCKQFLQSSNHFPTIAPLVRAFPPAATQF